jgi:hypothetical protein
VGEYGIAAGGAVAANYAISYVSGTLTVTDCHWQNPVRAHDVTGEDDVTALDVLTIINHINGHGGDSSLPAAPAAPPPFLNVNGDDSITPGDVLAVINHINSHPSGEAEGLVQDLMTSIGTTVAAQTPPVLLDASRVFVPSLAVLGAASREVVERAQPDLAHGSTTVSAADSLENRRFGRLDDHPRHASSSAVQTPIRRKLRRPSELDLAELATGDLEPVLDRIAGPIAAAWSRM